MTDRNAHYREQHELKVRVQNLTVEIQRLMLDQQIPSNTPRGVRENLDMQTDLKIKELQRERDAAEWEVAWHWRDNLRDS